MSKGLKKNEAMENRVLNLPAGSPEALQEILRGMYAGKPLLGEGGLLTRL
jgi:hypothetical protein